MNLLKKLSVLGWDDIIPRFLRIFLPLAIFSGSLAVLFYSKDVATEQLTVEKSETYKIHSQIKTVNARFESIITDLRFLAMQSELLEYLDNNDAPNLDNLASELLLFAKIKKRYAGIQIMDDSGLEKVRITATGSTPFLEEKATLQDKGQSPTFKSTLTLPPNKAYIMPDPFATDTSGNKEAGYHPMIRFSMPLVNSSENHKGIILLSHPIDYLLEDLQAVSINSPGKTYLVDSAGYYLNTPNSSKKSARLPQHEENNIADTFDKEWQRIKNNRSGQFVSENGLITFSTIYPEHHGVITSTKPGDTNNYLWKTVSFVPKDVLEQWPKKILRRIFLLYSFCLIIIGICSFMLARASLRRMQAEKVMRENEEELRAINEAAANAIIAIDSNKNILHWNPAAEKLFQYSATEVVDKPITSIISPPKHQSYFTKISRKFKLPAETGSMEAKTIELYGYKKDGTEFPVEVSFSAFKKDDQWHTVGIIRDISARKKMEKEVLRAHKFESLGVLSSGIANDFNNLLTAIIGNITLVRKLSGIPADSIELLKNAEKASRRVKALTQQLLTFSKEGMPIRKITAVDSLIRDSVEFALYGSTIVSRFDIPEDLLLVDVDGAQIGQVVQNIVTNARQAIKGSGAIHIECRNVLDAQAEKLPLRLQGNYVEIAIRDSGHGISERDKTKIFEPYFTTRENGSGLGLTIAQSIIQRHDGYIHVKSEENKGSTFSIYLPAAVDQHLPEEQEKKRGKGKNFKILVVDTEEMLLGIAGRMLVHLGHECVCAKSSREALDIYKHLWKTGSPVDGVIVDLTLPGGMGGKETAAAIFDINSEARIIVSSGYSNDPVMVDFDEYGFCAAIAKPFDMDELAEVIETVLE